MSQDTAWLINKREAVAERAMVAAMHPLASAAGLEMLRAGGNAVDAAVAAGFAIGVVEPFMSGLGGVCAMVLHNAADGSTAVVDGSTTTPSAAREDMYELLDPSEQAGMYGWRATRDDAQNTGYRSACVPGTPAALLLALERFGTLPRARVLQPAIRLAEEGFELDRYLAGSIAFAAARLLPFPCTMQAYFHTDGTPYAPAASGEAADLFIQSDLGRTLRLLAEQGPHVLYQGVIAERIARFMAEQGGLITEADLAAYRPRVRDGGLQASYRGVRLVGVPELSGCVTAYQALNILECFDLATLGAGTEGAYHLIAEASRRAFLDRFAHLGDPNFAPIPWQGVLSNAYGRSLADQIDPQRASPDAVAGDPWAYQPGGGPMPVRAGSAGGGGCTTHVTVIDEQRNMAALTSTLGAEFGSGVLVPGTGILLNNGMTWFDPEPGHVNSIAPNKRIFFAPTPTLGFRNGRPLLAVGAPGGRKIISAIVQVLVNVLDFGMGMQDAVSYPRVHSEGRPTLASHRIDPSVLDRLARMGHVLEVHQEGFGETHFARPNGILIDADGTLHGGVNQYVSAWAMGI